MPSGARTTKIIASVDKIISRLLIFADKIPIFKLLIPFFVCLIVLFGLLIKQGRLQLLEPAGYIADIQSRLLWGVIIFAGILGSVIIGSFFIVAFRFRADAPKRYEPDWTASKKILAACWAILVIAILPICAIVWATAHQVDPYRPIEQAAAPVTIQVVALRWKWLFIYPYDRIATVNKLVIPVGTPVEFQLTADAPMNSFWIPRLSGQVYAMTGMVTQLHIEADKAGIYNGSSAELSGADFAGMDFTVSAVPAQDYSAWKIAVGRSAQSLDYQAYTQLAKPSSYNRAAQYTVPNPNLFQLVVMQFMVPGSLNSSAANVQSGAL